jgi:uncharacterized protein (DUF2236 family)
VTFSSVSISARVNGERLALSGWCRAILLQVAQPLVAAGVAAHSPFRGSALAPVHRLRSTVRAMLAISFGTPEAQDRALEGIRTIHRRVHGHLGQPVGPYAAGTPYSAEDPALLLWVHATLLESVVLAVERLVVPLTPLEKDAYCAESAWTAVALGAQDADVPRTWSALTAYMRGEYASGRIAVGDEAKALADAVLGPPMGRLAWPALWVNRTLTIGLLPPDIRRQYGYRWTAGDARRLEHVIGALRLSRSVLPRAIALWPEARRAPPSR